MNSIITCAVLVLVIGAMAALPLPVVQSQGPDLLEVDQLILFATVAPGESRTLPLTVRSVPGASIGVEIRELGQAPDGRLFAGEAGADHRPYSAAEFLTVSPRAFHLEPGQRRQLEVGVSLPPDVGEGGRYAVVYVFTRPPAGEESVGVSAAIAVSVVLTVGCADVTREGELTEVQVGEVGPFLPLDVAATFANQGNYHYRISGAAALFDQSGTEVARATIPRTTSSVLPSSERILQATLRPDQHWAPGTYVLQVDVFAEDGRPLASRRREVQIPEEQFEVTAAQAGPLDGSTGSITAEQPGSRAGGLDMFSVAMLAVAGASVLFALGALLYRRRRPGG